MRHAFLALTLRAEEKPGIAWQPWSDQIFERAKAEHRFVLLDLGAGWCHWCHVMDELTYSDPQVAALYAASGDASCLADARRAAEWITAHRALPGGGFRHDEKDAAGPYLADTLAMARAFLALYTVTAERAWLARAEEAAAFADAHFRSAIGFATAVVAPGAPLLPKPQVDENIALVCFANLLHAHTGKPAHRAMAEHAMRFLASPLVVERQGYGTAGMLLADREIPTEPAHLTVVGAKDDPAARALFAAALRTAPPMARIEWFDAREGALPRTDVEYPKLEAPAIFLCTNGSCSRPMTTPEQLVQTLTKSKR